MKRRLTVGLMAILVGSTFWSGVFASDAAPNDPLWEQTFSFPNYNRGYIYGMAVSASTVLVSGTTSSYDSATDQYDSLGFIKAFDVNNNGIPKWHDTLTLANTPGDHIENVNTFDIIILNGNIAVVQGCAFSLNRSSGAVILEQVVLRGYNADTGVLLWEDIRDGNPGGLRVSGPPVAMVNNRAIVAGFNDFNGNFFVRAYKITTTLSPLPLLLN